jgi:hypothetical protein
MLEQLVDCRMIGLALKPRDVYDSKKKDVPTNEEKNQNTIICSNFLFNRHFDMN